MKKLLSIMLLAVGIIFASQFVIIENVSAQEVYAVTENTSNGEIIDHYVITDSVQSAEGFVVVGVHSVGKNCKKNYSWIASYQYANGEWNWIPENSYHSFPIRKIVEPKKSMIYGILQTALKYI